VATVFAKIEEVKVSEEYSEKKVYGDEVIQVTREQADMLRRAGLWYEWDQERQVWLGRKKDIEFQESLNKDK
jgi:hypothetical protein